MQDVNNEYEWERQLGASIVRQAVSDWDFDILVLEKGEDRCVQGRMRTVSQAKGDMLETKAFVENGVATLYSGISKEQIKEFFKERTPRKIWESLKW